MSKENVEVMETVEPVVEMLDEVEVPTPEVGSFDVQSIGKSFSNRVGDVALNMIASAAVVGAANGAMWIGKKVGGFVKTKIAEAKEAKALKAEAKAKAKADLEAETTTDSEEDSEE